MGLALCLGRLHLELGTLLQGRVPFRHVPEARSADAICSPNIELHQVPVTLTLLTALFVGSDGLCPAAQ